MAVVDIKGYDGTAVKAYKVGGSNIIAVELKASITNGDSIGSVYRLGKIPSNLVPLDLKINCTAIAGVTDADLGLYETAEQGGAVIAKDRFVDGATLAVAKDTGSELSGISALGIANRQKTLAELAGDYSSERQAYDLALTINAAATADGTVVVTGLFINGA